MRASTLVMIAFALVFGIIAVFIAQIWLANQANKHVEATAKPVPTRTLVVAKMPLRYGTSSSMAALSPKFLMY